MLQNVLSFLKKNVLYFQILLGVWQILKFTPLAAVILGVLKWLLSLFFPGFFSGYERLKHLSGRVCKTVKCVTLKGMSQSMVTKATNLNSNGESELVVYYLNKRFDVKKEGSKVEKEGNKVFVNEEMLYYISDTQWEKIRKMAQKCRMFEEENKVVFVKGCRFIWPKTTTGEVMEFEEVLDNVIFENKKILISDDVSFLPVDLSKKSGGKFPKLLNLLGLSVSKYEKTSFSLVKYISFASAIFLEIKAVRSCIDRFFDKMFCWSVQSICNKLPYSVRWFVYLLFKWGFKRLFNSVKNLMPRNDIRLKVVKCDLNVVIGGSAKINSAQEFTQVDWLDQEEKEYKFRCGCSIVMKATYDKDKKICTATMEHTSAVFRIPKEKVFLNCPSREEFMRIGTFLSCLAASKAGSLFQYDRNDNIVHVRKWRASLRDYVDAEFPKVYKLRLHDVTV